MKIFLVVVIAGVVGPLMTEIWRRVRSPQENPPRARSAQ